jgi:DNA-directed RNA polymerase specialized sigma24 family protein
MSPPDSDNARWFAEEVLPHDRALRGYLRGSFPAVRDVEDVVQESYLRIWRTRAAQPIRSARGFLFRIAAIWLSTPCAMRRHRPSTHWVVWTACPS